MAASVQTDAGFTNETPARLFDAPDYFFGAAGRNYDVAPDGRFLMIRQAGQTDATGPLPQITVILNWFEELTARVPVP